MYVSRVRLENIRGFSDRRDVDLTLTRPDGSHVGWTVLAGRNGSGKTSLLRAIALAIGGPWLANNLIPDFRSWITVDQQRGSASVQLVASPEDFQSAESPRREVLDAEIFWEVDQGRETSRPGSQPRMAGTFTSEEPKGPVDVPRDWSPWQADPIGWFCAGYGPFRRLVGGSAEAQRLMSTPGRRPVWEASSTRTLR